MMIALMITLLICQAMLTGLLLHAQNNYDKLSAEYMRIRQDYEMMLLNVFVLRSHPMLWHASLKQDQAAHRLQQGEFDEDHHPLVPDTRH